MQAMPTFVERVAARSDELSPAEHRVAEFFHENREEVLIASALTLAAKIGTSDATVVRTAQALGYAGMEELRQQLATELRQNPTPAARLARTIREVGSNPAAAFDKALDIHEASFEALRRNVAPELFQAAVDAITSARRVFIFGIGPSSAIADYFAIQLARFGIESGVLRQAGLLLADDLRRLRTGDVVILLAYGRVYRELEVLLDHTDRLGLAKMLLTDTLGAALRDRVDLVLPVERGRTDQLSMHTTTLGLIEALLIGIAARRPADTVASLESLNDLRARLVGGPMDLPRATTASTPDPKPRS